MTDEMMYDSGWLAIKKTPKGFFYAERKGKDSIALFLTRRHNGKTEILIRYQPLPLDNTDKQKLYPCPITGSLGISDIPHMIAIEEAEEEAGYHITEDEIKEIGKYAVGTQTNEVVHMFWADVTGKEPEVIKGDGTYWESISKNEWMPLAFLKTCLYGACQIGYLKILDEQKSMFDTGIVCKVVKNSFIQNETA